MAYGRAYNFNLSCNVAKVSRAKIYPFDREAVNDEDIGFRNPGAPLFHKVRQKFDDVCLVSNFEMNFFFWRTEEFFVRLHCI